jgi:hypothetical protein
MVLQKHLARIQRWFVGHKRAPRSAPALRASAGRVAPSEARVENRQNRGENRGQNREKQLAARCATALKYKSLGADLQTTAEVGSAEPTRATARRSEARCVSLEERILRAK